MEAAITCFIIKKGKYLLDIGILKVDITAFADDYRDFITILIYWQINFMYPIYEPGDNVYNDEMWRVDQTILL